MSDFKVSIITPVYNAEKFLRKSVESAVALPQVGEVILIEDASPDNALELCEELVQKYEKVKLYRHPGGFNKGASESRNLGISKSSFPYIAFLDADDYYLPERFKVDEKIFLQEKSIDGVYNAVGLFYYDSQGKEEFKIKFNNADKDYLTTVTKEDLTKWELFETLISIKYGYFHINGITLKKSILDKTGLFNTELKLHEDSHLWIRLGYYGNLKAGNISTAVAIRGVHAENRHTKADIEAKEKFLKSLFEWAYNSHDVDEATTSILFRHYLFSYKGRYSIRKSKIIRLSIFFQNLVELIFSYPGIWRLIPKIM